MRRVICLLWTLDTTTGLATSVGNTDHLLHNLAAAPDGVLYGNATLDWSDVLYYWRCKVSVHQNHYC